jgi:hypothetical protein
MCKLYYYIQRDNGDKIIKFIKFIAKYRIRIVKS